MELKSTNKNHETLIFDYGCVISHPQNMTSVGRIMDKLKLRNVEDFNKLYSIHRAEIDSGLITLEEYWTRTLKEINVSLNSEDFKWIVREDIVSWADINEEMIGFIKELKSKGHSLAILSNMVTETLDYLKKNTSFIELFDHPFFSCDFNLIKPDPRIYKYILDQMKVRPEDCIFIDDLRRNCDAAEKSGIRSILFTDILQMRSELGRIFG
ncbi:MAG TPA: HAD family phosphatase [Cyclobacteriaceae bacterium]|nr:HAD family phosphatase [Cyclobacteriaceae bacterium]